MITLYVIDRGKVMQKKIALVILCMLLCSTIITPFSRAGTLDSENRDKNDSWNGKSNDGSRSIDWWPMFRHDPRNTGSSLSVTPSTKHLCQSINTGEFIEISSPTIVDDRLYIGTTLVPWSFGKSRSVSDIFDHPRPPSQVHYGSVLCYDAVSGKQLWKFQTDSVLCTPAVVDNRVCITSTDPSTDESTVHCLNATTGDTIWEKPAEYDAVSSPIIENGKVYVSSLDYNTFAGKLHCYNIENGQEEWTFHMPTEEFMAYASPAISNNKIYFAPLSLFDEGCNLYCLNAATGRLLWSYPIWYTEYSSPAVANGNVYMIGTDESFEHGKLYCLNSTTGSFVWNFTMASGEWISLCSPIIYENHVYMITDHNAYCFDANDGDTVWQVPVSYVVSSPAIADNKIFLNSEAGVLSCLNASDGIEIWNDTLHGGTITSPTIAGTRVYTADFDGFLYAYGFPSDPPQVPSLIGTTNGNVGTTYTYDVQTTDPNANDVYYYIDWGDGTNSGWVGAYSSGAKVEVRHTWTRWGTYEIRAKSKDSFGYGSSWSASLFVSIAGPDLKIESIRGGIGITVAIKNQGNGVASNTTLHFSASGGLFVFPRTLYQYNNRCWHIFRVEDHGDRNWARDENQPTDPHRRGVCSVHRFCDEISECDDPWTLCTAPTMIFLFSLLCPPDCLFFFRLSSVP